GQRRRPTPPPCAWRRRTGRPILAAWMLGEHAAMKEKQTQPPQEAQPATEAADVGVARLKVTLFGETLNIAIPIPAAPVGGAALIPIARALAEGIGERAVAAEAAAGRHVSCRKGCGACCRQLVPLPVTEARRISALVEAMPEPRRSTIRA